VHVHFAAPGLVHHLVVRLLKGEEMNQIKAWKDPEYRASLTGADLAGIAENPAGPARLNLTDLGAVQGGGAESTTWWCATISLSIAACNGTKAVSSIGCC
jgi:mersacidin/lichenicidin family type 2 lantibiotic